MLFDNLLVADDAAVAAAFAGRTWAPKCELERASAIAEAKRRLGQEDGDDDVAQRAYRREQWMALWRRKSIPIRAFLMDVRDDWDFFVRRVRHNPRVLLKGHGLLMLFNIGLFSLLLASILQGAISRIANMLAHRQRPAKAGPTEQQRQSIMRQVERTTTLQP